MKNISGACIQCRPKWRRFLHNESFILIVVLLGAASQRIEYLALEFIGTPWLLEILADWREHERGSIPGPTECCIMIFIISIPFQSNPMITLNLMMPIPLSQSLAALISF